MRVAELSRRTDVSVASIKYYLREGLLPSGEPTGRNQADYGEGHVRRLRLVRALLDVGGLSVAATKQVLASVDDEEVPLHEALGVTQGAINPPRTLIEDDATERARKLLADLVARRGWRVDEDNPGLRTAVDVLATYDRLGHADLAGGLDLYAEAMEAVARHEVDVVIDRGDRESTVEGAVVGTVLGGTLIGALRSMAQESASARRLLGD